MNASPGTEARIGVWLRDLPPASAEVIAEHTVERIGSRATGTRADRDELSDRCYQELMANAETRLIQDVARLVGQYARVCDEAIGPGHHEGAGAAWPHGRFYHRLYDTHLESR